MVKIKLIAPSHKYKEKIMDYRDEFLQNRDSMDGTANLRNCQTFEEWYSAVCDNLTEETVSDGLVPATVFLAVDEDDRLIGMIDIRHRLNEYLLQFGGHIGYSVRKTQRLKGYATEMLSLALPECRKLHIDKCLVTCDKNNTGSAKVIQKNGGILENEIAEDNGLTQRYWIKIS